MLKKNVFLPYSIILKIIVFHVSVCRNYATYEMNKIQSYKFNFVIHILIILDHHSFFAVLDVEPYHKFRIRVKSEGSEFGSELEVGPAEISLNFEYTPTYPDEPPLMEVLPEDNIEDEELEGLREQLQEQV